MPDFDNSFTEEQQNLIDGEYDAILVTAPAGAGKTRLLVGRARALIESGVPQDQFVFSLLRRSLRRISASFKSK